jgi:hypothetical protein
MWFPYTGGFIPNSPYLPVHLARYFFACLAVDTLYERASSSHISLLAHASISAKLYCFSGKGRADASFGHDVVPPPA